MGWVGHVLIACYVIYVCGCLCVGVCVFVCVGGCAFRQLRLRVCTKPGVWDGLCIDMYHSKWLYGVDHTTSGV